MPFGSVTTSLEPSGVGQSTVLRMRNWCFNGNLGLLTAKQCCFGTIDGIIAGAVLGVIDGAIREDIQQDIVADGIAIFEDHLEAFLSVHWPEWTAACDRVEVAADPGEDRK